MHMVQYNLHMVLKGVQGTKSLDGARGVLAPHSLLAAGSGGSNLKYAIYNPDCDALVIAIPTPRLYNISIKKKYLSKKGALNTR